MRLCIKHPERLTIREAAARSGLSPNALQAAIDANRNTFVRSAAAGAQYEGSR